MPVTADQPAPYAPASAVLDLVVRHRKKGLQAPIDADVLARSGISDSLIPRTLQALRVLDLIGEDGHPSEVLEGIRLAPESEYKRRLSDWLSVAYADALAYVDPATDDEVAIRDAFRKYIPTGQQSRMVSLFTGLFMAADIMPERPRASAKQAGTVKQSAQSPLRAAPRIKEEANHRQIGDAQRPNLISSTRLPPALAGLLATLPEDGGSWTQEQRDKFVSTFGVVVDYCFSINEPFATNTATDS